MKTRVISQLRASARPCKVLLRSFSSKPRNQFSSDPKAIAEAFLSKFASGQTFVRKQLLDGNQLRLFSLTLDRPHLWSESSSRPLEQEEPTEGSPLPAGYHLAYFTPSQLPGVLGLDGTDASFNPEAPFTRRMWAGGSIHWPGADPSKSVKNYLKVGDVATEVTKVLSCEAKTIKKTGESMLVVGVEKEFLDGKDNVCVVDKRNWVFRKALDPSQPAKIPKKAPELARSEIDEQNKGFFVREFTRDPVQLFRMSALTFNAHRIHYDLPWARDVEGHRNVVVHGPLNQISMIDFWRDEAVKAGKSTDEKGIAFPKELFYRATSPVYAGEPYRLMMPEDGLDVSETEIQAVSNDGTVCMKVAASISADTCKFASEMRLNMLAIFGGNDGRCETEKPESPSACWRFDLHRSSSSSRKTFVGDGAIGSRNHASAQLIRIVILQQRCLSEHVAEISTAVAMIPQTPSTTVSASASAENLLKLGKPFIAFPRFSILDIQSERDYDGNPVPFSEWLTKNLQIGKPFVITDFDQLETWPRLAEDDDSGDGAVPSFSIERLIELSTKKNIPIRNCSTGRDLSFTLNKFVESARQSFPEFQNLYARDLPCPQEWLEQCRELLPTEVQWGGRLDLFQWLPQCARSEVMMAYVGSEGSCSGFHRCFSSTIALNFLVDREDDRPVVCIGTDFDSQQKYDSFMSQKGVSPHLDWHNLGTEEMLKADFPLYVCDQKVGDLVVLPPATAHQIWNPSTLSTKLVWNTLHPLSLEVGIHHVQPPFNRLCHPDVARTNLSLAYAMLSLVQDPPDDRPPMPLPPDLPLLSKLFRQMVHDETIEAQPPVQITKVQLAKGTIATCNFCSTAIWNRHVRCTICADFDLCLLCYLNGRSCEHSQSYAWVELVSSETCNRVLTRAREILGFQLEEPRLPDRCKTLGTAVNDLIKAKENQSSKLCHLCRIDHPEWKGKRCDSCTAFFCYRGLYRHFDIQPGDVLRHSGIWTCPKCDETCNCRCCHFATAYVKNEKPASKRRVKASDPRGKVMGFADNVFDQKRGNRRESNGNISVAHLAGKKRAIEPNDGDGPVTPLRKLDLPTPEPDFARSVYMSREGSEFGLPYITSSLPPILPSVKSVTDMDSVVSPLDDRQAQYTPSTPMFALNGTVNGTINTLPPMIPRTSYIQSYSERKPPMSQELSSSTTNTNNSGLTTSSYLNNITNSEASLGHQAPQRSRQTQQQNVSQTPLRTDPARMTPITASPSITYSVLDENIKKLESQIQTLQAYEEEFVTLNLEESRKQLRKELHRLETQLAARKRERGLGLVERLQKEGFSNLAESVRFEVGIQESGMDVGLGIEDGISNG